MSTEPYTAPTESNIVSVFYAHHDIFFNINLVCSSSTVSTIFEIRLYLSEVVNGSKHVYSRNANNVMEIRHSCIAYPWKGA